MNATNYRLPNCVVLLAAVFATRRAYEWATDTLPIARNADYFMNEPKVHEQLAPLKRPVCEGDYGISEKDDTHDAEYREESTCEKRRIQDIRENGTDAVLEYERSLE